ncbi:hypothetical protein KKF84_10145 [Myxococcota bacterium]|nr:hypothetical protein [Myxococcota bacterium]MBU1535672.1 hypothetical protein [Myxococcota bacterium]
MKILFILLFIAASCTPEPPRDTTADTHVETVDSPGTQEKVQPQDPIKTFHPRDHYASIPRGEWQHSPTSPLDTQPCSAQTLSAPDKRGLRKVMAQNGKLLLACYQKGLKKNPTLGGSIALRFLVRSDASVRSCTVTQPLSVALVGRCMCSEILRFKGFTGPTTPGCLNVYNYTLKLSPPN